MKWYTNKKVLATYGNSSSQVAYANISDVGWIRIKTGATDAVTNIFSMMNAACANGKLVHVGADSNNQIVLAYLLA
ncbi:MAG: peptidase M6 [Chloroflexi bacterium]|nr:peptidase M6 [Chloroflexota bacterium]MDA1227038.1 peptidase M6 [Chloroflexota bacterium]